MREPRSRQASINGGSSDSELTAFAVAPAGPCSPSAVTIVTPVGSTAIEWRSCSGVGGLTWATGSMMPPVLRRIWISTRDGGGRARRAAIAVAAVGIALAAGGCGTQGIQLADDDPDYTGAVLFAERCSGCHSLDAAGAQGSANRALRNQGPNLNERVESPDDVLYAIRNGGFSGAIMPQNIVVGDEADAVADFVAQYAGGEVDRPIKPGDAAGGEIQSEQQQDAASGG